MSKDKGKAKEKKNSKFVSGIIIVFLILSLVASAAAIYGILLLDSIENLLRYISIGVIGLIDFIFIYKTNKHLKRRKKKKGLFIFSLFLYFLICAGIAGTIFFVYGKISSLNKESVIYTSDLLVMSSNEAKDIKDIKDMKIGLLKDKKNPEGYIIPKEIIKEHNLEDDNEIKKYDDYHSMLVDLYANELDAMFVSDSYEAMFSSITGYENIRTDTRVIISKDKKMKKSDVSEVEMASAGKSITEPFTILLMGIDSTDEVLTKNAIANGDTLILITFNPKTLNATMLSIPRDSYVPIACWSGKPENKITHAAAYGTDCMINTIENYFDVNIDYYAKINFKGLVKLVDAVGGVEVDVEKTLCTDNSNRESQVCIHEGHQNLNGEQALVYARNRKQLANGDFGRAEHQQIIVKALINKIKTINDVSKFMDILNTVSNSTDTNLTTKQILSFYNVGKDIVKRSLSSNEAEIVNIQPLFLQGTGQMIYDERSKLTLWDYVPNKNSRKDIIQAMKENLEKAEHTVIKEFSFSINEPYEKKVIGEGPYKTEASYSLLPDFTGDTEAQARAAASRYGISVTFVGNGGTVISQSYPAGKRTDLIKGSVVLTLSSNSKDKDKDKDKNKDDEVVNKNNSKNDESKNNNSSSNTQIDSNDDDTSSLPTTNPSGGNEGDEPKETDPSDNTDATP